MAQRAVMWVDSELETQYRDPKEREIKKWDRTSLRCELERGVSMVDLLYPDTLLSRY